MEVIIDIIIDAAINITISSTQTLASFINFNIFLRINPYLLIDKVKVEKWKRKIKRHILAPALPSILK